MVNKNRYAIWPVGAKKDFGPATLCAPEARNPSSSIRSRARPAFAWCSWCRVVVYVVVTTVVGSARSRARSSPLPFFNDHTSVLSDVVFPHLGDSIVDQIFVGCWTPLRYSMRFGGLYAICWCR